MKFFKILLAFLIIAPFSGTTSFSHGQEITYLTRTVTAFGATSGEAYANARAKIPTGYIEINSSIQKVGYKYLCYLKCRK